MSVQFMTVPDARSKKFTVPIDLTPKQQEINDVNARFKVIRAGRKFGKSTYEEYKCITKCGKPRSIVGFIGPTYRQAKLIAWMGFKAMIPRETLERKPNETELYFTFKNGSRLHVFGADEPDALRGLEFDHVGLEEAAMHKSEVWYEIVRPNLAPRKGSADFISTPKGFNWFKDLEDKARERIAKGDKEWSVHHYSIYDNPHNSRDEIEKAKTDCDSEIVWRQEYMAEFEATRGRVFSQFSDERHCRPFKTPLTRFPVYRAVDYGMRDDTACVWGYLIGRDLYVYREHLQSDTAASEQSQLIQEKTEPWEDVQWNIISHDTAKQDAELLGLTVKWHFENSGMRPMRLSSKDKAASRHMLQRLINEDRLHIDATRCPKLRKQLLAYEWNDTLVEKILKPKDGRDDAVDALHYLVEGLQAQLFLDYDEEKPKDWKELSRLANVEMAKMKNQKYKLDVESEDLGFEFENTPAGYL